MKDGKSTTQQMLDAAREFWIWPTFACIVTGFQAFMKLYGPAKAADASWFLVFSPIFILLTWVAFVLILAFFSALIQNAKSPPRG